MAIHYAMAKFPEQHAKAIARDAPVSTKHCVEISKNLRGKSIAKAKKILQGVITLEKAIPFKRATLDLGHKKGMGPGRFPQKAASVVLTLLESAEANAQIKGLNQNDLVIAHIVSQMASRPWRYGRKGRAKSKRTHIEIVLAPKLPDTEEKGKKKTNTDKKKSQKNAEQKSAENTNQ